MLQLLSRHTTTTTTGAVKQGHRPCYCCFQIRNCNNADWLTACMAVCRWQGIYRSRYNTSQQQPWRKLKFITTIDLFAYYDNWSGLYVLVSNVYLCLTYDLQLLSNPEWARWHVSIACPLHVMDVREWPCRRETRGVLGHYRTHSLFMLKLKINPNLLFEWVTSILFFVFSPGEDGIILNLYLIILFFILFCNCFAIVCYNLSSFSFT